MSKSVLVIDSGVGGLTTLSCIRKRLNNINVIYYADDKFLPYGDKNDLELAKHICEVISSFENKICAVVLACNTATGVAVELARKLFCVPIIGTEPAILPACKQIGGVAVLVTPLASKQANFARLVHNRDLDVFEEKYLAKIIDDCLMKRGFVCSLLECEKLKNEVEKLVVLLKSKNDINVVLGCTHYVFLRYTNLLSDFNLFDGNEGVAKRLAQFVENRGEKNTEIVFGSGNKKKSQIALRLLNELLDF